MASNEKGDAARAVLLERLVAEAVDRGVSRLVLDSRDHASNGRDRVVLARTKARDAGIVYEHIQSSAARHCPVRPAKQHFRPPPQDRMRRAVRAM